MDQRNSFLRYYLLLKTKAKINYTLEFLIEIGTYHGSVWFAKSGPQGVV